MYFFHFQSYPLKVLKIERNRGYKDVCIHFILKKRVKMNRLKGTKEDEDICTEFSNS